MNVGIIKKLKEIVAEFRLEYRQLKYPCWEGVACHNESKMGELFELIEKLDDGA